MATTGAQLRDEGMARALAAEHEAWKERATEAVELLAATGQEFTSDHVRDLAGEPSRPNAIGGILNGAKRNGIITVVGFAQATRASRHASVMRVWRGA